MLVSQAEIGDWVTALRVSRGCVPGYNPRINFEIVTQNPVTLCIFGVLKHFNYAFWQLFNNGIGVPTYSPSK